MDALTLKYRHNTSPHRGLAASGILFLKLLLIIPHLMVVSALSSLANVMAYIGFWVVAFTGEMPQAVHRFLEMSFGWSTRTWAWIGGIVDIYPPFETDPDYPAAFPVAKPENPGKGMAVAGLLIVPKLIMAIPHIIALVFLAVGAALAVWVGYIITLFTGALPTAIQDFYAGVMQWGLRLSAWITGLSDEYPPFSLDASPTKAA